MFVFVVCGMYMIVLNLCVGCVIVKDGDVIGEGFM